MLEGLNRDRYLASFGAWLRGIISDHQKGCWKERRTFAIGHNVGPLSNSEGRLAAADWLMHEIVHDSPVSGYT